MAIHFYFFQDERRDFSGISRLNIGGSALVIDHMVVEATPGASYFSATADSDVIAITHLL